MEILRSFLDSSAFVYVLLFLAIFLVCILIACFFMMILRLIFKRIKFFVCLIIGIVLVGAGMGYLALNPFIKLPSAQMSIQAVNEAASQFHGFYGWKLPLLACRFTEYSPSEITLDPEKEQEASESGEKGDVFVKVQYLPAGEIVLKYDENHGTFTLERGLNQNDTQQIIAMLFDKINKSVLDSLPVAKPASSSN